MPSFMNSHAGKAERLHERHGRNMLLCGAKLHVHMSIRNQARFHEVLPRSGCSPVDFFSLHSEASAPIWFASWALIRARVIPASIEEPACSMGLPPNIRKPPHPRQTKFPSGTKPRLLRNGPQRGKTAPGLSCSPAFGLRPNRV